MSLRDEAQAERIVEALLAVLYPRVEVPATTKANCVALVLDALTRDYDDDHSDRPVLSE